MRPEPRTSYEEDILANVDEHGWFCTSVFDPNGSDPGFSYSVGFTETLNCPEFIVIGLPLKLMHSMLWSVFRQIKAGAQPQDGLRWSGVLEGCDCISRAVDPANIKREWLNSAVWFWNAPEGGPPLRAFQLVWPGAKDHLFPWDKGADTEVRRLQPPLWIPNAALQ